MKTSCAELGQIWTIGQCMWQRDFPGIYKQLAAVQWSDSVAEIMVALHGKYHHLIIDKTNTHNEYNINKL